MNGDNHAFRALLGLTAVLGSLLAFGGLFFIEIPARNENALMFAMGVIFGWGSAVFASEYGSSSTARKVTEGAIRQLEHQGNKPLGTPDDPLAIEGATKPGKPVSVQEKGKKP